MKIGVAFSKTVNMGNYESMRCEASYETEVDTHGSNPTEEIELAYMRAWSEVTNQVENKIKKEVR